ncbi:MAG: citramalate synthase [Fidelibacterota bacterium]|nr:MAG: citramalate synthase [Candidatus Neomarinimicrobiota bacterium]
MALELFDTTLRDGTQAEGINLSVGDKLRIVQLLDDFGMDIIEGGWPGSNPRDQEFFAAAKDLSLKHALICAFGSTARKPDDVATDPNLNALLEAGTPVVSLVGKTWRFHSRTGLRVSDEENEALIRHSVAYMRQHGRRVIFDAEHFFDGYKDDPAFSLAMIRAAEEGGADTIVLCDTNGGSLPHEVAAITGEVKTHIKAGLGIHAHNDGDLAVANTIAAVQEGVTQLQGTINGVGERCGNANLCSVIPNLLLKLNKQTRGDIDLQRLTELSRTVAEIMNLAPPQRAPFVGQSAFAHKGGIHVSAVMKDTAMYEHIPPESVGARRRVLVSDLSGQSNIRYKAREFGIDWDGENGRQYATEVAQWVKSLEYEGYQFDGAEASFELLLRQHTGEFSPFFDILDSRVFVRFGEEGPPTAEAVMKVRVDGEVEHTVAEGVGPVNALDVALRKALVRFYPVIAEVKLVDYKVRVLDEKDGTSAKVRVLVETSDGKKSWSTVGVSENIIEASWQALRDSLNFVLFKTAAEVPTHASSMNKKTMWSEK